MEPEGEVRHKFQDRVFHWIMAILVLILLGSAFLPILGIQFNWVPVHWISGLLLILAVIYHLYRSIFVHSLIGMIPLPSDFKVFFGKGSEKIVGKYDLNQKLYHWSVAVIIILLLVTGGFMMAKIDTPLWRRDPSILSDWSWGVIYTLHGAASLLLIFFIILHIYFAFLPEHKDLLKSMVFGGGSSQKSKGDLNE